MRSVGGPPPVPAAAGVNLLRSPAPGGGGGREGEGENPAARTRAAGEAGGFARGRGQVDPPPPVGPRADSGTTSTAERAPRGGRPGAKGQGPRSRSRGGPRTAPRHARARPRPGAGRRRATADPNGGGDCNAPEYHATFGRAARGQTSGGRVGASGPPWPPPPIVERRASEKRKGPRTFVRGPLRVGAAAAQPLAKSSYNCSMILSRPYLILGHYSVMFP